jgi:ATP-dependent Zn protease
MNSDLWNLLLAIAPMLLLVGAWYFFMQQVRRPGSTNSQFLEALQRQADALERIAIALEKRQ